MSRKQTSCLASICHKVSRFVLLGALLWFGIGSAGPGTCQGQTVPTFHLAWREDLTGLPRRIAVADVVGDGTLRLVTLDEQPNRTDMSTLTVRKWDGKTFTTEFTAPVPVPASTDTNAAEVAPAKQAKSHFELDLKLAVGKFAGAKQPAVIVTTGGLWYWDGKTFAHKEAPFPLVPFGATRLRSGEERVLLSDGANGARAYRVDTSAPASGWLTDRTEAPAPSQITWGDMHGTSKFLTETLGLPLLLAGGGMIGMWVVPNSGGLFLYYPKIEPQYETKPDPKDSKKTIKVLQGWSYYVTFVDPTVPKINELPVTSKLDGPPYDVVLTDPKGSGKTGLLILTGNPATDKPRSLYFFTLD
jgi:hypothetical protein